MTRIFFLIILMVASALEAFAVEYSSDFYFRDTYGEYQCSTQDKKTLRPCWEMGYTFKSNGFVNSKGLAPQVAGYSSAEWVPFDGKYRCLMLDMEVSSCTVYYIQRLDGSFLCNFENCSKYTIRVANGKLYGPNGVKILPARDRVYNKNGFFGEVKGGKEVKNTATGAVNALTGTTSSGGEIGSGKLKLPLSIPTVSEADAQMAILSQMVEEFLATPSLETLKKIPILYLSIAGGCIILLLGLCIWGIVKLFKRKKNPSLDTASLFGDIPNPINTVSSGGGEIALSPAKSISKPPPFAQLDANFVQSFIAPKPGEPRDSFTPNE